MKKHNANLFTDRQIKKYIKEHPGIADIKEKDIEDYILQHQDIFISEAFMLYKLLGHLKEPGIDGRA